MLIYLHRRRLVLLRYFEITNYEKPSSHQGISRSSPSPFPLILKYSFLSCSSSNFHAWYWYYSNSRYLFLQSITPQVTSKIRLSTEIHDISVFLFSFKFCFYFNERQYWKILFIHLLHPQSSILLLFIILKTYSNTFTTLVSQSQCHSLSPARVLQRLLTLTTTSIRPS